MLHCIWVVVRIIAPAEYGNSRFGERNIQKLTITGEYEWAFFGLFMEMHEDPIPVIILTIDRRNEDTYRI